jgi:8-oxo-dGTP pyrophosphatase MutT (NUDIX family)
MLDLDVNRAANASPAPRDAATVILLRDEGGRLEIFCVKRHGKIGFAGGAIVFPGGKVDPSDYDPRWEPLIATQPARLADLAADASVARATVVAACRELLEEAGYLPLAGLDEAELPAELRHDSGRLVEWLQSERMQIDGASLVPLSRWLTPEAETRRFDTRFFLHRANPRARPTHEGHENTESFWASAKDTLTQFDEGKIQLLPPTHRTLTWLSTFSSVASALLAAERHTLDIICPRLIQQVDTEGTTLALAMPGDPHHEIGTALSEGPSRFVLRGERWLPERYRPSR